LEVDDVCRIDAARLGLFSACLAVFLHARDVNAQDHQPVALSETIGIEIDADERRAYSLFPDVVGFVSAQFVQISESRYRVDYLYLENGAQKRESRSLNEASWTDTRRHVRFVEEYEALGLQGERLQGEDAWHYRIALRYAARARYDLAKTLIDDFIAEYPASPLRDRAETARTDIDRLIESEGAFFRPGALAYDRSGRTNLLLFAGYYGIWAAIAAPVAFESEDVKTYAATLLTVPTAALFMTSHFSKNTQMGKGRAAIISLGGNLGTWQGLGWAALEDLEGHQVVGVGLVSGLAGVALGSVLGSRVHFSEGHGHLTQSAFLWGGWYGLVFGGMADVTDDNMLRAALIGSDLLVPATGFVARNARMSENRVRLVNLGGVLGTLAAAGVLLLVEANDAGFVWAGLGAGSAAGLALGFRLTRRFDAGKDLSLNGTGQAVHGRMAEAKRVPTTLRPVIGLGRDPHEPSRLMTRLGFSLGF
jgi:hypothetical protein